MIKAPIWKDTYFTVSQTASNEGVYVYSISTDEKIGERVDGSAITEEVTIFNGKAWRAPKENIISFNINRICQDWLNTSIDLNKEVQTHENAYRTFYLKNENGVLVETYEFLLDWSYKEKDFSEDIPMWEPVNGHYAVNMLCMRTYWDSTSKKVTTKVHPDHSVVLDFDDNEIYDKEGCGEYALYYLNRHGGWDSFLIEGTVKKTDNFEKYFINRAYNNTSKEFGKMVYNNQITTTYEASTGWLSDAQSERMAFNLFSSNKVYLHHISTGEIIPAVITDTKAEYKTFKNNGKKMVNHKLTIEASHTQQNIG